MGYAKLNRHGRKNPALRAAAAFARQHQAGCVWGGGRPQSAAPAALSEQPTGRALQATLPSGFTESVVATGLSSPTQIAFLPDGRMLIALKSGVVRIVKDGASAPDGGHRPQHHPDIVNDYWDRGLLGIAVDPNFATNGYVYLLYTYENNAEPVQRHEDRAPLALHRRPATRPRRATEQVILGTQVGAGLRQLPGGRRLPPVRLLLPHGRQPEVRLRRHALRRGRRRRELQRRRRRRPALAEPRLARRQGAPRHHDRPGPPVQPVLERRSEPARSKVWAYGLRNPYRLALKPGTNVPYLGDVGWNTWEEINVGDGRRQPGLALLRGRGAAGRLCGARPSARRSTPRAPAP